MLELTINFPNNLNGQINFFNIYNVYLHTILGRHCLSFAYSSTETKPFSPYLCLDLENTKTESLVYHISSSRLLNLWL